MAPPLHIGLPRDLLCVFSLRKLPVFSSSESSSFLFLSLILVLWQIFLFLSELLQVSVAEMIGLEQYRLTIGCFVSSHASLISKSCEYV